MQPKSRFLNLLSLFVILTTILSSVHLPTVSAQGRDPIRRERNAESGRVSFIGPESGRTLSYAQAMGLLPGSASRPADPAMALAKRFASEFGLRDAERNLTALKTNRPGDGRVTVKYQQNYQGIPVMGGELIVNTNENGDLYSINGEVSQNLSLDTQPAIDSTQAKQIALEAMAKWNEKTPADFIATEPELWIFDESLLQPSTRPATLVWRMDVTSADGSLPIRELMLINAQTGNPDFHFNQIDTAWKHEDRAVSTYKETPDSPSLQTTWPLYYEMALDETRGWIYGVDSTANKVDVISTTTLTLVKSFALAANANPQGIALSPDGTELAIAQYGAGSIIFINPDTGNTIATLVPNATNPKPRDVLYGRTGRLYTVGNPSFATTDFVHNIDTSTHLEISRSTDIFQYGSTLAISADQNILYVISNGTVSKFDISTDILSNLGNRSGFPSGSTLTVDSATGYVFNSKGPIYPPDLSASIGSTNLNGQVASIPNRNAIAVTVSSNNTIVFINSQTFYTLSTYALQGPMQALVAQSDGNKLFVSTDRGIIAVDLTAFPPGVPGTIPAGSLPYADIVLDEPHGVLYGSNTTGHKIDVVSLTTFEVLDQIRFTNGSKPRGMDLSPDGNELAVALNGANQIAFIDTETHVIVASVIPTSSNQR